ncbi:MAG: membrane integrity-associated transporter subunit PqiC [Desulfobacterales bacterium]|nr:membrane integrity-associated transporter subunit PqiC [Desulfobacterales bacterium]
MSNIRKNSFSFFHLILLISLSILNGCLSPTPVRRNIEYYTLEYEPPAFPNLKPLPYVIHVSRFQGAPLYDSNKIIYKEKAFKSDAYHYHQWRVNPGDLITYFLARDMRQSTLFKAVFTAEGLLLPSTHRLEGRIDDFLEEDKKNLQKAVLTATVTLLKENEADIGKSILFQKQYHITEPCDQKNPSAVAAAMSQAMLHLSEILIMDIYNHLR